MIELKSEDREYLRKELSKYLKKNDTKGLIKELNSTGKRYILGFLVENNVPVLERLETIPKDFFRDMELTKIVIPKNIKYVGDFAFLDCADLVNVVIEDGVERLGRGCFSRCTSLSHIELPESIENIGPGCFSDASHLTSVIIPDSVTYLSRGMFEGCPDTLKIYANSRKDMRNNQKLKCEAADIEWFKEHLFVKESK